MLKPATPLREKLNKSQGTPPEGETQTAPPTLLWDHAVPTGHKHSASGREDDEQAAGGFRGTEHQMIYRETVRKRRAGQGCWDTRECGAWWLWLQVTELGSSRLHRG